MAQSGAHLCFHGVRGGVHGMVYYESIRANVTRRPLTLGQMVDEDEGEDAPNLNMPSQADQAPKMWPVILFIVASIAAGIAFFANWKSEPI